MMLESITLPAKVRKTFGSGQTLSARFTELTQEMTHYVGSRALTGLAVAAAEVILLLILGVDFPFSWGLWSLVLRLIPNIGWLLALVPPFGLAFLKFGVSRALVVFFGYFLLDALGNSVVAPRFMKRRPSRLRLSVLVALAFFLFWGWVLGGVGLLLAVPLTQMVLFLLDSNGDTRPLATVLSAGTDPEATVSTESTEESGA